MSATSGPRTRMCTHSAIAKTIATPARRLAAASSEWISVAGSTASRATAKSALVAANPSVRRIRDTTRTAGIRDDDEGRVDEKDNPDRGGANRRVRRCKWRKDVREERVTDDDEHDVRCDHGEEEPISSDGAKASSAGDCRCGAHRWRARYGSEHDQRESGEGDSVDEIENLERAELRCGCDNEASDGRTGTNTEVATDPVKREGGRALL